MISGNMILFIIWLRNITKTCWIINIFHVGIIHCRLCNLIDRACFCKELFLYLHRFRHTCHIHFFFHYLSPSTIVFLQRNASSCLPSFHIIIKLLMQFPHFVWGLHSMLIHEFISKATFKCNSKHNRKNWQW